MKLFSIRKDNVHIVFTVFGIRIKFLNLRRCGNNVVLLHKRDGSVKRNPRIKGLEIKFKGENSTVEIYEPYKFVNCKIKCKDNNYIKFGPTSFPIQNFNITKINHYNKVIIGKNFSVVSGDIILEDETGLNVIIGDDCMFSSGILIRPSDGHTIIDKNSGLPLNAPIIPGGVEIGNRVWLGMEVCVLKNSKVPNESVVGAKSLVTKRFDESNVVIAGAPAKIVKHNIIWDRRNTETYIKEELS